MQIEHRVHPGLAGLVTRVCGYDYRLDPAAVHHGVPGPETTVIVSFDEPLDVGWADGTDRTGGARRWLLASGLHVRPALIRTHGVQHGIQVSLTPAGTRALLGVPMGALARVLADHADLPLGVPADLHARLAAAPWGVRFALLEQHLLRLAARARGGVPADLAHGWQLLGRHRGRLGVTQLADALGWSRRHLSNRFSAEFGLPPREVARLHRFGHALALARRGLPWAEVAARSGFTDQPHLVREFGAFAGQTPTRWRDEVFPNHQASGA